MNSNAFFENWRGSFDSQKNQQNQFKRAKGSSLKPEERKRLLNNGVIYHPKGKEETKVFVMGNSADHIWSVIIPNEELHALKVDLHQLGYSE